MSNKATFNHNGEAIGLTKDGKFSVTIGGEEITKPTLAAIKKAIDATSGAAAFRQFEALYLPEYTHFKPGLVTVTSIGMPRGSYIRSPEYRVSYNDRRATTKTLYENTPENIAVFKALQTRQEEYRRVTSDLEKEYIKDKNALIAKLKELPAPENHPQYKKPSGT